MSQREFLGVLAFLILLSSVTLVRAQTAKPDTAPRLVDALKLPFLTNGITATKDGRLFLNEVHLDGFARTSSNWPSAPIRSADHRSLFGTIFR
jgi:hypothetical protein